MKLIIPISVYSDNIHFLLFVPNPSRETGALSIFIFICKETEVWATFLRSSERGRQTPDPQPLILHLQGADGSRWRLLKSLEDRERNIFRFKTFASPFIRQELPFQHFLRPILCLVEFRLEFLQIPYTLW